MTNLKEVVQLAEKFYNNVDNIKNELKRVQSIKCRLAKQKAREDYNTEMTKVVTYEQALKEARSYLEPKKTTVTTMTQEDIKILTYDETVKAIKAIQSKKCNAQYLTNDINTNEEYQSALKIEEMLQEHKKTVKPIEDNVIQKSKINDLIHVVENLNEVKKEYILEQLKKLLDV